MTWACATGSLRPFPLAQLTPHGFGSSWTEGLVRLHAVSDALIAVAYFSIPFFLLVLWRRRRADLPHPGLFLAFALFILACGATHALEVWNVWHADHWLAGWMKALTAAVSLFTAAILWRSMAFLSRLPTPQQLEKLNQDLERRVRERTQELSAANAALQASEEMFRAFMDHSPISAWIVDSEDRYHYANQAVLEQFSPGTRVIGSTMSALYPPELAESYNLKNRHVLELGRALHHEARVLKGVAQVHLFPLRRADGRGLVGGVGIDVTHWHEVNEQLRQQGGLMKAVAEAMNVYLENADWKTAHALLLRCALEQTQSEYGFIGVMVDGPRLRILAHEGIRWDEHLGRELYDRAMRDYAEHGYLEFANFENLFGRVISGGGVVIANAPQADPRAGGLPPGHPAMHNFLGVPVRHEKNVIGLIGVANRPGGYDVAAQERLELLVQQAAVLCDSYRRHLREAALEEQVRVSQKMEAVGLLAGGVAHDFNNLLQVIQGYTSMALDSSAPWPERRASLDQVRAAADRAAQLTQQLLAFGRQQTLQRIDLDLNKAITDLVRMIRRVLGEQIAVDFIPGHDLGNVHADRAQVDQVLLNLCLNARDALAQGGRITLETENVLVNGAFRESHPWAKPGRYVLVTVSDNGLGMDKATQAHIFEPFFTTKPKGKGTGLGLAVVYGVVKQHEGMVHVYSEPGKGTTFKIYLPIVARSATSVGPKHTPVHPRGTETILLAEDEAMVRDLAVRILTRSGYRVIAAADGAEAVNLFQAHADEVALLLFDVVMPQLGGRDAHARIAALRPGIPVIFCSGYAGSALDASALNAPGARLLAKPYGADELLQAVRTALDRS